MKEYKKNKTMEIKDYIKNNWEDTYFDVDFSISGYSNRLKTILHNNLELATDIKPVLEGKTLSRKKVFEWVKKDPYKGFLAAMLWGGISTMSSSNRKSNAERAFSVDKKKVVAILTKTTELLKLGKEREAFDYLGGDGKIEGIGISYFTKIMYFFSPGEPKESLIFDKWGRFMHAAFLIDDNSVSDYYSFKNKNDFKSELHSKKPESEIYLDYLDKMRSVEKKGMASPGHLEAFLFGKKLYKKNQNDRNPRHFIYSKVKSHFTGNTSQSIIDNRPQESSSPKVDIKEVNTVEKRHPTKAYRVVSDGTSRYVFIGEDKRKTYCEVYSKSEYYPEEHELSNMGFVMMGGSHPYYIVKFKKNEIEKATALMNDVLKLYPKKQ